MSSFTNTLEKENGDYDDGYTAPNHGCKRNMELTNDTAAVSHPNNRCHDGRGMELIYLAQIDADRCSEEKPGCRFKTY